MTDDSGQVASSPLAQSVHARLVSHAKNLRADPNGVFARFAAERFLYRLSESQYSESFVLKGAFLLLAWHGEHFRPTRDVDLLGYGALDRDTLTGVFREICATPVEPDGLEFDAASINVDAIRAEDAYGGQRVTLHAHLGPARLRVQVDIGIGDAVVPNAEWLDYPSLLGLPKPRLRAYRPETVIAEKVHTMILLGSKNSRMRDFFDVHFLANERSFDGAILANALRATFARRETAFPTETPLALTAEFANVDGKPEQWAAFLRRNRLAAAPADLALVVEAIGRFAVPLLAETARAGTFSATWPAGGPWRRS